MLEVEGLHVSYGRVPAVRGVSVAVEAGEIVGIVGPNGAGKSTTLLTIAGALSPSAGAIRLDGASIAGQAPEAIARLGVSLVPENRHVFTQLTVEENLRLGSQMRRDRDGRSRRTSSASSATSRSCGSASRRRAASSRAASSSSW